MPRLFLIAPPLDDPFISGVNKPFRILTPCQAPSLSEGAKEDAIHLTHHEGFTIKNPNEIVHKCKSILNHLDAVSAYVYMGAAAAGSHHGFSIRPGDIVHGSLVRLNQMAHNRDHINHAGIEAFQYYSKQRIADNHQIDAMKALFRSAGLANNEFGVRPIHFGGTKWVCEECYQVLSERRPLTIGHLMSLDEYIDLTRRTAEVEVTLRCSASVITFTRTIQKSPQLRKVIIHIKSEYFLTPERQTGTQYNAIEHQFIELGKALQGRSLTSVDIRGDYDCGPVFAGLQWVLRCSDLKMLHVKGITHFLQGAEFRNNTRKLEELQLDGVHVDIQEAANNLTKLFQANSSLKVLCLTRSRLMSAAVSIFVSSRDVEKRFAKLLQLDISNNEIDSAIARTLVAMALKGDRLTRLDLSNNYRIGDSGCRQILELLKFRGRRLDSIVTDTTGISYETSVEIDRYRNCRF
ncbi:hypothetical protein BGZ65_002894 [Modicella reniformis]|uniref:Uncharacterized protein n=1 Tax=Modicella reniformis TaxID=1440133 RepID=A0A9P6M9I1_9FUNG|nr:hypothetical protein BGZ65_002894 [Modicella reniformis]